MSAGRTIYIAGAGIAGLTLALALAKFGATVIVLERGKTLPGTGAGLQISPNARRILNQLGVDRQVAEHSFEPAGIDVVPFGASAPLVTLTLGDTVRRRFGVPYAVMHRADLAELLYRSCRRFANIDFLFGVRSFDVAAHARGVSVVADEESGSARSGAAFAFVGADGVNSPTRTSILGGPAARYSGGVAWRATLPLESLAGAIAIDRVSLLLGPGFHAVCYPLSQRGQVNIALFAPERELALHAERAPTRPSLPAGRRSAVFDAILAAGGNDWTYWPLSTVETPVWHKGGIGLVGDAAHAMLPHQAQGAAMGIEDAAILAPLLMTEPNAEAAFARYAALRRPRVERVRQLSKANGEAFHMHWPLTAARDTVIRLQGPEGHLSRLSWLYGYDAAPDPAIAAPRGRRGTSPAG